jgi:hypothetical protein
MMREMEGNRELNAAKDGDNDDAIIVVVVLVFCPPKTSSSIQAATITIVWCRCC